MWEDILEKYPNGIGGQLWDADRLSKNVPWDFIFSHPQGLHGVPWNIFFLGTREDLRPEYIIKYSQGFGGKQWNMYDISQVLSWNYILNHPQGIIGLPWSIRGICKNKSLDFEYVEKNPSGFAGFKWDCRGLSGNPNLQMSFLDKNFYKLREISDYDWDLRLLSKHPCLEWNFVSKLKRERWDIEALINNPNIVQHGLDNVLEHLEHLEHLDYILRPGRCVIYAANPALPWDIVLQKLRLFTKLDVEILSSNPNINWTYVLDHPEGLNGHPWSIDGLSKNISLPWDIVLQNLQGINGQPWNIKHLSMHPMLPWTIVQDYPEGINNNPWNVKSLSLQSWTNITCDRFKKTKSSRQCSFPADQSLICFI